MDSLKDIALQLLNLAANEDKYEIIVAVAKPLRKQEPITAKNDVTSIPEVFINTSEVERLLKITRPVISKLTKDGVISTYANPNAENNKFILNEILWLQKQKYTFLTPIAIKMLLEKKKRELN